MFQRSQFIVIFFCLTFHGTAIAQPVDCAGTRIPLTVSSSSRPYVHMRLGDHEGMVMLDTGASLSHIDAATFGVAPGSSVRLNRSSLPTLSSGVFYSTNTLLDSDSGGKQIGTIGTDLLAHQTVAFHYDSDQPYVILSSQRCPSQAFEEAGFIGIAQQGHYAADLRRVQAGTANIPVIFIRIGMVTAPVWIDTGDGAPPPHRGPVMINDALFQKLRAAGIPMRAVGTARTTDCKGRTTEDHLWHVEDQPLAFTTAEGEAAFEYGPPLLLVRQSGGKCGTIGEMSAPFGTIGASYLLRWGTVVFDGFNERVWVAKHRAAASPQPPYAAMAAAWNKRGGFTIAFAKEIDGARQRSLSVCNEKNGDCALAPHSAQPSSFACMTLARNLQDQTKLYLALASTFATSRTKAAESCSKVSGRSCQLAYSACNDT